MISLTNNAIDQVKKLMIAENRPSAFFRVGIKEGCCEDMSYDYKLDDRIETGDQVYETDKVKVVCDAKSLPFLDGMAIDFAADCSKEDKVGFKFINPNAKSSCECGASFSM